MCRVGLPRQRAMSGRARFGHSLDSAVSGMVRIRVYKFVDRVYLPGQKIRSRFGGTAPSCSCSRGRATKHTALRCEQKAFERAAAMVCARRQRGPPLKKVLVSPCYVGAREIRSLFGGRDNRSRSRSLSAAGGYWVGGCNSGCAARLQKPREYCVAWRVLNRTA